MRYTRPVMVAETAWRELYRSQDLLEARAVATSIAAMEFDACLCAEDDERPGYVIRVRLDDWPDLADVLPEILHEQQEFDRRLEQRKAVPNRRRIVLIVTLTGIVEVLAILRIIEL